MKSVEVSKTNPTVKKIIDGTVAPSNYPPLFKGKVTVEEVRGGFHYDLYLEMGTPEIAFTASVINGRGREVQRPSINRPRVTLGYEMFEDGETCVIVYKRRNARGSERVTIYIPELDAGVLSIATDALIEKNKGAAVETLKQCGAYAGIALAVVEAHVKTLGKAEGCAPKSTRSAAKLEREINAFLDRR